MKNLLILAAFTCLIMGCRKTETDEYLLSLDQKRLAQSLNYDKIFFYKFAKIAIRSSAVQDTSSTEFQQFTKHSQHVINSFSKVSLDNTSNISVTDAILMYRDYRAVHKLVKETDEDIFPTLTEALNKQYSDKQAAFNYLTGQQKRYNENIEHAVLSMVVLATKDLGKDFALYECSKTQPESLKDSEEKTLLEFVRGVLFFSHQLHYLSEDGISRNIDWLNKHKDTPLPYTRAFFGWKNFNDEQSHTAFLAMNHLFRGFDRLMMKRDIDEERALIDFELFLEETKKLGLENESVWAIESFLYLKKDDPEKGIPALRKLLTSPLFSDSEKKSIQETIEYLENDQHDSALKGGYNKFFIAKIVTKYTFSVLAKINWERVMTDKKVPHTAELFQTMGRFRQISNSVSSYMNPGVLETGKKKLMDGSNGMLDKAKGLFKD